MSFTVRKIREKPCGSGPWLPRVIAMLTIIQPLMGIYREWKKQHDRSNRAKARASLLKRILLVLVAVFFAFLLLAGIGKAIMSVRGLGITNVIGIAGAELPKDANGYTNFLLLGQGDQGHDGKNLTDTVMVASTDPDGTKSTVLLSLPRDLYLIDTEKMGKGKLNTMYRDFRSYLIYEKGMDPAEADRETLRELARELGKKLDMEIHHVVKVDFIAFVRAVDLLGGVDVEVPYDIEDFEYPDENFGFEPFILKQGLRHFDGETALKYARSRHTSSDFGRSARQQQLLHVMAEKAREEGVLGDAGAITSFMKIMQENVATTMKLRELIGAASIAEKLDKGKIISLQLNDRNALYDSFVEPGGMLYTPPRNLFGGAAVLLPVSIPEFPVTWKQPQVLTHLLMNYRNMYLEHPTVSVLNAGAPPGTARKLATELIRFGFDVPVIENADIEKRDISMIVASPEPDALSAFFGDFLGLDLLPAPTDLALEKRSRVTILLGRNYRYTPLQDLIKNMQSDERTQGNTGDIGNMGDKGSPVSPVSFVSLVSPISPSP